MNEFNPYQAPSGAMGAIGVNDGSRESLRRVASYQRGLIACIGAYLLLVIANMISQSSDSPLLTLVLGLMTLVIVIAGAVFMFLLSKNVYSTGMAILFLILGFIPCVGFILLLVVNSKASSVLKQNGIQVGFFGADPATV